MIPTRKARKGFTLIELLVVVVIIGLLIALAFPVTSIALRQASQTKDASNLRQLAAIVNSYTADGQLVSPEQFLFWDSSMGEYIAEDTFYELMHSAEWSRLTGVKERPAYTLNQDLFRGMEPGTPGYSSWKKVPTSPVQVFQKNLPLMFHGVYFANNNRAYSWGYLPHVHPVYSGIPKESPTNDVLGKAMFLYTDGSVRMIDTSKETIVWK